MRTELVLVSTTLEVERDAVDEDERELEDGTALEELAIVPAVSP